MTGVKILAILLSFNVWTQVDKLHFMIVFECLYIIKVPSSRPLLQDVEPLPFDLHERHDWPGLHDVPVRHPEQEGFLQYTLGECSLSCNETGDHTLHVEKMVLIVELNTLKMETVVFAPKLPFA